MPILEPIIDELRFVCILNPPAYWTFIIIRYACAQSRLACEATGIQTNDSTSITDHCSWKSPNSTQGQHTGPSLTSISEALVSATRGGRKSLGSEHCFLGNWPIWDGGRWEGREEAWKKEERKKERYRKGEGEDNAGLPFLATVGGDSGPFHSLIQKSGRRWTAS